MNPARDTQINSAASRKRVVDLLARATRSELEDAIAKLDPPPSYSSIRGPETGLVMVRGRIGGGGSPFNLGEATMTRASIRLADGTVGHGYRLGTDRRAAMLAAVFDALAQNDAHSRILEEGLLGDIEARIAAEAEQSRRETAATKVDFFTMVRGED